MVENHERTPDADSSDALSILNPNIYSKIGLFWLPLGKRYERFRTVCGISDK